MPRISFTVGTLLLLAASFVVRSRQQAVACALAFLGLSSCMFISEGRDHRYVAKAILKEYNSGRSDRTADGCPTECSQDAAIWAMHLAFDTVGPERWHYLISAAGLAVLAIRAPGRRVP